jgi:hypothetical protein
MEVFFPAVISIAVPTKQANAFIGIGKPALRIGLLKLVERENGVYVNLFLKNAWSYLHTLIYQNFTYFCSRFG